MLDRPDAAELLEALAAFLDEEVVPAFEGGRRFHALVAANVARILAREAREGERLAAEETSELAALLGRGDNSAVPGEAQPQTRRDALYAAATELCGRIERGDFDDGPKRIALVTFLKRSVERRLEIDNPKLKPSG